MSGFLVVSGEVIIFGVPAMPAQNASSFLGFDRNEYPGDQNLKYLRATFSYAGYWLNNPPGTSANTWPGKRAKLEAAGLDSWCCSTVVCIENLAAWRVRQNW